ncbi:hypothetical protein F4778DRAFT_749413 [Xylariomycetidae sp. FL2044]|nr:hypothetical protein F4778DRAFT_749413 [Xylariomycetidae sp. FL2044]
MPGVVEPEQVPSEDGPHIELPVDNTPPRRYVVMQQHVDLEIDFRQKLVHGWAHIVISPTAEVDDVYIDARQCEIDVDQITVSKCKVEASYKDPCESLNTPANYLWSAPQWSLKKDRMRPLLHHRRKEVPAVEHEYQCCTPLNGSICVKLPSTEEVKKKNRDAPDAEPQDRLLFSDGKVVAYRVSIPFKSRNSDGIHFAGMDVTDSRYPHAYTRQSVEPGMASAIFPCIDDPHSRNSWKVSITCPRTLGDAFQQPLATQQQFKDTGLVNGSRKRKREHNESKSAQPTTRDYRLTEGDKLLELTVICSGYLTDEVICKDDESKKKFTFEIDKNKAAKHVGFAVGPFEHVDLWSEFRSEEDDLKLGTNAVKVHGYCLPGRAEETRNTCATIVTAVDYFVLHFGRYPFESYKVCFVDDMVEDTVPFCTFSLCSNRVLYPREIIDTEVETTRILVHALASQWFGINIIPNTKSDIWLVVGIAWFMTDLFMRFLCGKNEFMFRMKIMSDRIVELDIKRPSLHDLGEHLYLGSFEVDFMNLKAPLVLFILDARLSKTSGAAGISRIISRMVSKANTSDSATDVILGSDAFRKACEKIGNQRLENFWNQYIIGAGCPRFQVFQRFNKKRLCVEMTVRQTQDIAAAKPRPLDKDDFWRDVMEETHAVYAGELHHSFTGPMTIRIHEADGTPYEHIVEIREATKSVRFEIPYNTKYKRLKRNRRQRERAHASSNAKGNEENHRDLYYLGDVFQHPDEIESWEFWDWDEETEAKMDQESYEWIRMDADFEWICEMETNLPAYMYASQLQQDRDVVAQQDSMLFLHRNFAKSGAHPLVSTILTRTLLDPNYFYGIRLMASEELPRHAVKECLNSIGLRHLLKTFQHFFCYPGTFTPRPNDFSNKQQYVIQGAIPEAVARVRGEDGLCPKEARRFILEQLQHNNNEDNICSDQFYICRLIKSLATCLVPDETKVKQHMSMSVGFGEDPDEDEDEIMTDPVDNEPAEFKQMALDEIESYRRKDEYSPSFHNCFTVAALDALCILMKAKVIPENPLAFAQYMQDLTYDAVRIKAHECLVELGLLSQPAFLQFFLRVASTDPSPYIRDRLFKVLCRGIGSIAIGEHIDPAVEQGRQEPNPDDGLIVEQANPSMVARQKAKARKEDLATALAALKEETKDNEDLQQAIWDALGSPVLSVTERINILELCSILVEEDHSLPLKFFYPVYWTAKRGEKSRYKMEIDFKRRIRTKSRKKYAMPTPIPAAKPDPPRKITLNLNRTPSITGKPTTPVVIQPIPQLPVANGAPAPSKPQTTTSSLKHPPSVAKQVTVAPKPPKQPTPVGKVRSATPSGSQDKTAKSKETQDKAAKSKEAHEKPLKDKEPLEKPVKNKEAHEKPAKNKESHEKPAKNKEAHEKPAKNKEGHEKSTKTKETLEKSKKAQESHRDSISVQAPVRPTIEHPQSETKTAPAKLNGNGNINNLAPVKQSKALKRASTEIESPRPKKIVRLNTSRIVPKLQRLQASLPKKEKIVIVKFEGWDKLKLPQTQKATGDGSIRATPRNGQMTEKTITNTSMASLPHQASLPQQTSANPPSSPPHTAHTNGVISSSPTMSSQKSTTSTSSHTQTHSQGQVPPSSASKPRKRLPDVRKPLPSGPAHHTAQPPQQPSASSASPPGPKPKFKIKLKTQS